MQCEKMQRTFFLLDLPCVTVIFVQASVRGAISHCACTKDVSSAKVTRSNILQMAAHALMLCEMCQGMYRDRNGGGKGRPTYDLPLHSSALENSAFYEHAPDQDSAPEAAVNARDGST